tara:strand:+ start:258 stop:797 length:540 start_codon:yes stop_codon:yes gene_type:complete
MLIFDLETDGLLRDATKIHCLCIYDTQTEKTMVFNDQSFQSATERKATEPIVRGIQLLEDADYIIGHNIIGYDIPIINKFYPWFRRIGDCLDTLLLSRLYHPNLTEIDKQKTWEGMPLKLYGSHSLASWGYRLNEHKGDYCEDTDWKEWTPEMENYMIQDVTVTKKLWTHFQPYLNGLR